MFGQDYYSPSIHQIEEDYTRFKRLLAPALLAHGDYQMESEDFAKLMESFRKGVTANRARRSMEIQERIDREIEQQETWATEDEPSQEDDLDA